MQDPQLSRRRVLRYGAALAGAGLAAPSFAASLAGLAQGRKTQRVILIAFAGGVRTRETLGTPDNVPNLMQLANEGVVYPRARTANLGHFGAALSIFTGISEARGIRENARGPDPTLFEYVRKSTGLKSSDVWISTSGGAQQANYAYGLHAEFGARYGANTLDGDGIFNDEFKGIVAELGRPREMEPSEQALLERMRKALGDGADVPGVNDADTFSRVERYILDELRGGTSELRGVGASDHKALRVARNLMSVFRPRLLGVALQNADIAHGSYNSYVEVIRRNDAAIGELMEVVRNDPELADSTAVFVLPEFGRDTDLNSRRGLDHGDGSDDLNYVPIVAWGPDFGRGKRILSEVRTIDVCPTICGMFGADPRFAKGRPLAGLAG